MDIDAFVAANQAAWWRLKTLTAEARSPRKLSPQELDELLHLYQRAGANLATARITYAAEPSLVSSLTLLVSDAHGVLYGRREVELRRSVVAFATNTFPAGVWELRRFVLVAALCLVVPWAIMQTWISISPVAFDLSAPEAVREEYIERDFEEYYSSQPAQNFATQVFFNNIRVGFFAFAAGVLLCVVTAALLAYNGAMVGMAGGLFTHVGHHERFWGLILPHGLLELSAVVVAGAAGLRIGWSVIDPGDRRRRVALAEDARRIGPVLIGLVVAFLLAAIVEGFVTGRPWSTVIRVGIGVGVFTMFWGLTILYAIRAGRST